MHAYRDSESPTICSSPLPSRQATVIIPRLRDVFTQKMDYRTEFEQLLGGKVENPDTTPKLLSRVISSPQVYTPPLETETVHRMKNEGIDEKAEGIAFKVPAKPV